jgi:RNA polymerase sigma-70 factor (ECF subfamily)
MVIVGAPSGESGGPLSPGDFIGPFPSVEVDRVFGRRGDFLSWRPIRSKVANLATTTNGDGSGEFGDAPLVHARALASHHGFVRALARGLVSRPDFDDVAQEALLAGLKRPPARAESLTSWLATTVRHLASKLHRGDARRAHRQEAAARPEALPSAHELVERIELEQVVVRAVIALKEPQRTAVLLRFYEGHATAAIAEKLGVPADTVRARLRRGLAELRVQLDTKFG